MSYNPNPTRVWSRVQDRCTYTDNSSYENVYVPLTRTTMPLSLANYQAQLIAKGNILQYKKNSSQLTKKQKYTQICKGLWTNRTKSYATQTQTYTNPNTSNLLRVNYNNIISPSTSYINGPYNYSIPYPNGCISDTIKDGGALLCNTVANPCTDEVIEVNKTLQCYPTTCSDVPGPEQLLCWDSQLNTWYPRQRYIMPTSGTGYPEGYKGFVSALKPPTPILTLDASGTSYVTLSWTVLPNKCIPISSYNIYLNGQIYTNVPYTITSITIDGLYCSNTFYVASLSNTIESTLSNSIITNNIPFSITGGGSFVITNGIYTVTFISNGTITFYCSKNINVIAVGGGGGGGGGSNAESGSITKSGGGGGGGGGIGILNLFTITQGMIYDIIIGTGGKGGKGKNQGAKGTDSLFKDITTNYLKSLGGGGGTGQFAGISGGAGGNASSTLSIISYNGGNGGNGFGNISPTSGYNTTPVMPIGPLPNGSTYSFSGGGGGGIYTTTYRGGLAGLNGIGGLLGGNSVTTGQSATSYGSGGGGSGCPETLETVDFGGNGANGIVIIYFSTI